MPSNLDMDFYNLIIRSALGLNIASGADIEFVKESETTVAALLLQGDVRAVRRQQ